MSGDRLDGSGKETLYSSAESPGIEGLLASVFALKARRDASQDGCEIVPFDFVQPSGSLFIGLTLAFEPVSQLLQKLETVEAGPVTI